MTVDTFQRFEVMFGSIFLGLGLLALLIAGGLYAAVARSARHWPLRWAFLGAPLGIGVIFTLVGATSAGYGLRQMNIERHILATGTSVRATVTDVEQTYTRVNGRYLRRVYYEYTASGAPHRGSSGLMAASEAQTWRPGDAVFVRYDPAQPSMSIWLGREDRTALHPAQLTHADAATHSGGN